MNSAEEIVRWLSPALQLVGIVLLLRWPKVKGWGPLMGSAVLSFVAALGWRLVRFNLEDGTGHLIVRDAKSRAILDTWAVIERSLYLQGEVLFLGFVIAVAFRRRLEANGN